MNTFMKKGLMLVLVISLALTMVFAAGGKETKEPRITIASADNTYGISTDPALQQAISDLIKEKSGVAVDPIIPPLASYTEKLATLVNSGDAPDVMNIPQAMAKIPQMVARGQLLDLTEYVKNSESLSKLNPSIFMTPYIDGNIYHIPYNYPKSKGIVVRKDIMEQYGINLSSTPTTDEFLTEMKKLVGTGIQPFTFPKWVDNFQFFYNSFGAWGGVYEKDGQYIDGFQTQEMKDALTYINTLYNEGILNAEFITTENSQMREKTYTAQSAADIDYVTNYINYIQNTAAAGKPTDVHYIYKLVGPNGDGGALNEATQTAWTISSKAKDPESAFKVIEALVTDPELYPAFYGIGIEGQHYTVDEAGNIVATKAAESTGYKYTLNYLSDSFIEINVDELNFKLSAALESGLESQRAHIAAVQDNLGPNHSADVPVGASDAYDRVSPSIKSTRESIAAKIVIGTVTVEEGMAEYANFWTSINGPQILAELNATL